MGLLESLSAIVLGDPVERGVRPYRGLVERINHIEPEFESLSDEALSAKTVEFKERLSKGESLDDLLPEAFATVREASKRVLGMRHFDVQLIGGIVLHQGKISEMKTGEGKTLVATLPAYLNALEGKGVYIVTVNDYLAKRDSEWMGQLYQFLGLSVGLIQNNMAPELRLEAYQCDITFGTNNEFGFDYLRDNLAWDLAQCCQLRRHYAIVDEVDSILIDEARTPLIISGPVKDSTDAYKSVAKLVRGLKKDTHFTIDEKHKNIVLTEDGTGEAERLLGVDSLFSVENMAAAHMLVQCLKALHLFSRDVDYVVKDGQVVIVDEFTGRLMEGRRYSDGLHQAIEAIENLKIREESQTLASVTFQNYFRMFPKLAGMTGTAKTEETEFRGIYGLEVVVVPTNKPIARKDKSDVVYKSKAEKYKAIVADIKEQHKTGQPVLVGTISIEVSEHLASLLKKAGIPHNVLNAKYHESEADIISQAGQQGSVTIATNMAGRGTDIVLGEGVKELGGLSVIGTGRHESRRIDNQLRGRSGRQGDPGASKFYVSLDDDLMRLFGSDRIASVMERLGVPDDTPIEHGMVTKSIERAQKKVERYHFGVRKQVLQYDDVMNVQRETMYALRRQFLELRDIDKKVSDLIEEMIRFNVLEYFGEQGFSTSNEEALEGFVTKLSTIAPISNIADIAAKVSKPGQEKEVFRQAFLTLFQERRRAFPDEVFDNYVVKQVFLGNLDRKWVDHLHNMEILREGIGLRAYGQRDPLMEYRMEGFDMFKALLVSVTEEALELVYRAQLVDDAGTPVENAVMDELTYNQEPSDQGQVEASSDKVGRNDPCPCGSGKKYKKCCMPS